MSFIGRIIGTILFKRGTIKDVAESDDATMQAWLIIFVGSLIGALFQVLAYQKTGDSSYLGPFGSVLSNVLKNGSSSTSIIAPLVITFLFQVLFILFFSFVLAFVGRAFGGKFSTMGIVRMFGFISVRTVLSNLVSYLAAVQGTTSLLIIVSIIGLWELILYIYSYSVGGDIGIIRAIIALIVALIIAVILLFVLVITVFVSIFAILATI